MSNPKSPGEQDHFLFLERHSTMGTRLPSFGNEKSRVGSEQKSWSNSNPKLFDSVHLGVCSVYVGGGRKSDNYVDLERVASVPYISSYFH